ncbi:MAG TPA: 3-deoxy-manno-octulosonate cytidylyltransferase [Gammaproteobacteria bacterium]|nr:3-deoxy-manno-octulosonate cytidylyltransferase [Gammaproteobacteria bacterium]
MSFHVVIPARHASTRLPGKPLLEIAGRPMIWHVCQRALESGAARVVVATDDPRIAEAVGDFQVEACLTAAEHQSGTDRIAEVARILGWGDDEVVVNLQGDEPLMPPALLERVARVLAEHPQAAMATLGVPLQAEEVFDSNAVKLVTDREGMALYFSRAPIPWKRGTFESGTADGAGMYRHLGLYAYRVGFLHRYVGWPPAPIEEQECLEQLRVLWQGERIAVGIVDQAPPAGVDTEADYRRVQAHFSR